MPSKSKRNRRSLPPSRREAGSVNVINTSPAQTTATQPASAATSYNKPGRAVEPLITNNFGSEIRWIGLTTAIIIILLVVAYYVIPR